MEMAKIINLSPVRSTFLVMAFLGFATIFSSETSASVIIPYDSPSLASLRNLIHDDTPAGLAQATVLLGEIVLMHKSTQAASTAGAAALNRTKQALNKFASFVEEEQSLALAAQAAGKVVETPRVDMIKNARDLAVLASEEGAEVAGKAWINALQGNGKIVINQASGSGAAGKVEGAAGSIDLRILKTAENEISTVGGVAQGVMSGKGLDTQFIVNVNGIAHDLKPTLDRIAAGSIFPHRNDGSIFKNFPPKGQATPLLPTQSAGYYREFVYPTPGTPGPGAIRIVTGQNGEAWLTLDHYKTFIQIKK